MIFINSIQKFNFCLSIYINYIFDNTKIKKIINQLSGGFIKKFINF